VVTIRPRKTKIIMIRRHTITTTRSIMTRRWTKMKITFTKSCKKLCSWRPMRRLIEMMILLWKTPLRLTPTILALPSKKQVKNYLRLTKRKLD